MKTNTLASLVAGCSLLAAAPAFADDAAAGGGMIDAPPTLPMGKVTVYGDVDILHLGLGDFGTATQEGLHLGGAFGISEALTAGVEYTAPVAGDLTDGTKLEGPLRAFGQIKLAHDDKLSVAVEAHLELNLCGTSSSSDTGTTCATSEAVGATLDARVRVAPTVAIFTGNPLGVGVAGGVGGLNLGGLGSIGGFLNGGQLTVGFGDGDPSGIALPVGIAVQPDPKVFFYAETVLATVFFKNGPNDSSGSKQAAIVIGSDNQGVLLNAGAFVSPTRQLDVGVTFFDNLQHAGDLYVIGLAARAHM